MTDFPTTRWSLIHVSSRPPAEAAAAWSELVRDYRPAILRFFRGSPLAREADDLTQEFLLRSMREGWWSRADVDIGTFRRFLLVLLKRFLRQQREHSHRHFEVTGADGAEATDPEMPERQFDLEFALCLTRNALSDLRADYVRDGRGELYDALLPWLSDPSGRGELVALGARLQVAPNTLAVQLKRMRARFRKAVRATLAQLCIDAEHAATELDALRLALAADTTR